jgi:hypothetical protein
MAVKSPMAIPTAEFDTVVREVVFVGVNADSELASNGLAVDWVEQRVQFIGDDFVSIDIAGVRYIL